MKRFAVAPLILVLALVAGPTSAQERRHGRGDRAQMRDRIAEKLGLTDAQRTQLEQQRTADGEAIKAARQAVQEKRQALEDAMISDPSNQNAIDMRRAELAQAQGEMVRQSTASRTRALQVLTAEQREMLKQIRTEMRNRREAGRGRSNGRGLGRGVGAGRGSAQAPN